MNRIPTNSTAMRNIMLLNALTKQHTHKSVEASKIESSGLESEVSIKKKIDPDIYDPHVNKYGYGWIDDFTFKRDTTGPLTKQEEELLHGMKLRLMRVQQEIDAGWYNKKGTRANPYEWDLIDEDGYPRGNLHVEIAQSRVQQRNHMNLDLNAALESKGVMLTDEDVFSLTVNFDNTVTVSGHADEARGKEVERALNDIGFSNYSLALHIWQAGNTFQTFSQCTYLEYLKYTVNSALIKNTGYSINRLTVRDDGVFTDDGKDINELFYNAIAEQNPKPGDPNYAAEYTNFMIRNIRQLESSGGILNIREASFTIEYRNNSLCDINTTLGFGVGQRDWYDKLVSLRGDIGQKGSYLQSLGLFFPDEASPTGNLDIKA